MLNAEKRPFVVEFRPHVDPYEIECQVKEIFEREFGGGEVVGVYANQHPYEIGVTLFLKHYDRERAWRLGARIEDEFAAQGVQVGVLVMPESELVRVDVE